MLWQSHCHLARARLSFVAPESTGLVALALFRLSCVQSLAQVRQDGLVDSIPVLCLGAASFHNDWRI